MAVKNFIIPTIVAMGAMSAVIAGCGTKEVQTVEVSAPVTTVENVEPTQITSSETTSDTLIDTVGSTESTSNSEVVPDPSTEAVQDGRDESEITNGDDSTLHAPVGSLINLQSAMGDAYEVGNITIVSGDSVSVSGRDSVIAEKAGTSVIECTVFDNETNTSAKTNLKIVVE